MRTILWLIGIKEHCFPPLEGLYNCRVLALWLQDIVLAIRAQKLRICFCLFAHLPLRAQTRSLGQDTESTVMQKRRTKKKKKKGIRHPKSLVYHCFTPSHVASQSSFGSHRTTEIATRPPITLSRIFLQLPFNLVFEPHSQNFCVDRPFSTSTYFYKSRCVCSRT